MYPMWWLLNTSQNCKSKLESTPRKLWLESLRLLFTILGNELLLFDTRINDTCNCCRQTITFNWISCLSNMLYKVQISFYGACASSEKWNNQQIIMTTNGNYERNDRKVEIWKCDRMKCQPVLFICRCWLLNH